MKYEIFEHTADVGIKVFGHTCTEIFNNAVEAFADIMLDLGTYKAETVLEIEMSSSAPDLLLVDLLSEILYHFEAENQVYFKADLEYHDNCSITGRVYGCGVGENPDYRNVVKAVTYHMLEISPEKGYAIVVFDI